MELTSLPRHERPLTPTLAELEHRLTRLRIRLRRAGKRVAQ
jgi:hypothetical protein